MPTAGAETHERRGLAVPILRARRSPPGSGRRTVVSQLSGLPLASRLQRQVLGGDYMTNGNKYWIAAMLMLAIPGCQNGAPMERSHWSEMDASQYARDTFGIVEWRIGIAQTDNTKRLRALGLAGDGATIQVNVVDNADLRGFNVMRNGETIGETIVDAQGNPISRTLNQEYELLGLELLQTEQRILRDADEPVGETEYVSGPCLSCLTCAASAPACYFTCKAAAATKTPAAVSACVSCLAAEGISCWLCSQCEEEAEPPCEGMTDWECNGYCQYNCMEYGYCTQSYCGCGPYDYDSPYGWCEGGSSGGSSGGFSGGCDLGWCDLWGS